MRWIRRDVNRKGTNIEDMPPRGDQGKLPGEMEQRSHDGTPTGRRRGRGARLRRQRKLKKKKDRCIYGYVIFNKVPRYFHGDRRVILTNGIGMIRYLYRKKVL